METFGIDDGFRVTLDKEGSRYYTKVTYPVRYGRFTEVETRENTFQFNLNGEIKYIQGRSRNWPDSNEWLKRTVANDWVYYASGGGYSLIHSLMGEYYRPCFPYPSNSIFQVNPLDRGILESSLAALSKAVKKIREAASDITEPRFKEFVGLVTSHDRASYLLRSQRFHALIGGRITVLPPDARHVDYDVIPVIVADGCLYSCGFCTVKSGQPFSLRSKEQVLRQIQDLKDFYGRDLGNYNSVFLGQHDALGAGKELLTFAACKAHEILGFEDSNMKGGSLFLFGSIDSINNAEEQLFSALNGLPYYTYINIGLESADQKSLALLRKPVSVGAVEEAFSRMMEVNRRYDNIEITANFVMGDNLPDGHLASIVGLTSNRLDHSCVKGGVYFSPLNGTGPSREMQRSFMKMKHLSRLPAYLYLIQRL